MLPVTAHASYHRAPHTHGCCTARCAPFEGSCPRYGPLKAVVSGPNCTCARRGLCVALRRCSQPRTRAIHVRGEPSLAPQRFKDQALVHMALCTLLQGKRASGEQAAISPQLPTLGASLRIVWHACAESRTSVQLIHLHGEAVHFAPATSLLLALPTIGTRPFVPANALECAEVAAAMLTPNKSIWMPAVAIDWRLEQYSMACESRNGSMKIDSVEASCNDVIVRVICYGISPPPSLLLPREPPPLRGTTVRAIDVLSRARSMYKL